MFEKIYTDGPPREKNTRIELTDQEIVDKYKLVYRPIDEKKIDPVKYKFALEISKEAKITKRKGNDEKSKSKIAKKKPRKNDSNAIKTTVESLQEKL